MSTITYPIAAGRDPRYLLTMILQDAGRPLTVRELVRAVETAGFRIRGRPGKTVSDALRWEVRKRRIVRAGQARYGPGRMPRSTKHWIRQQLRDRLDA